jgi:ABC-type uncharacterized transport system involved in gliding motility auxiliary subunit
MKFLPKHPRARQALIFALCLVIVGLFALDSNFVYARIDLSADKVFSLSAASRELMAGLRNQLVVHWYLSKNIRDRFPEVQQLEDLLAELAAASRGKMRYEIVDPIADKLEGKMRQLGVSTFQVGDQTSLSLGYSGLVLEYLGKSHVFPLVGLLGKQLGLPFGATENFEFAFSSAVLRLSENREQRLGFLLGDQEVLRQLQYDQRLMQGIQVALRWLDYQGVEISEVQPGEIPDTIDILFVMGSKDLDQAQVDAIGAYLAKGGRALIATRGIELVEGYQALEGKPVENSPMLKLLASWGAELKPEVALDDSCYVYEGPTVDQYGPSQRQMRVPLRYVVKAGPGIVRSSAIVSGLTEAWFSWPSPIVLSPVEGISATELVRTSDASWRLTQSMSFTFDEQDSMIGIMEKDSTSGSSLVACALKGRFPGASGGKDDAAGEGRAILISDADFLWRGMGLGSANLRFIENGIAWLAGDESLIEAKKYASKSIYLDSAKVREGVLIPQLLALLAPAALAAGLLFARRKTRALKAEQGGKA